MSILTIGYRDEVKEFILSGSINETSDFILLEQSANTHIIFSFEGLQLVNSIGLKKWSDTVQSLQERGKTLEYRNCPLVIVMQFKMTPKLIVGVKIHSFEVEYYCEECDIEDRRMLLVEKLDLQNLPLVADCPSCQQGMLTQDSNSFHFLLRTR